MEDNKPHPLLRAIATIIAVVGGYFAYREVHIGAIMTIQSSPMSQSIKVIVSTIYWNNPAPKYCCDILTV
jgi:hypothetical protein